MTWPPGADAGRRAPPPHREARAAQRRRRAPPRAGPGSGTHPRERAHPCLTSDEPPALGCSSKEASGRSGRGLGGAQHGEHDEDRHQQEAQDRKVLHQQQSHRASLTVRCRRRQWAERPVRQGQRVGRLSGEQQEEAAHDDRHAGRDKDRLLHEGLVAWVHGSMTCRTRANRANSAKRGSRSNLLSRGLWRLPPIGRARGRRRLGGAIRRPDARTATGRGPEEPPRQLRWSGPVSSPACDPAPPPAPAPLPTAGRVGGRVSRRVLRPVSPPVADRVAPPTPGLHTI